MEEFEIDMENVGVTLNDSDGKQVTIRQVKDSYETVHTITKVLGQGGQGLVCLTENKEVVVKFALDSKGQLISHEKNPKEFEQNDMAFNAVVQKPFPDRLHLAYPMARLTDYSGYVMRLMGDMTGYGALVPTSVEQIKQMAEDGGHRRRFLLLSKLAAILAKLHGNGMVYCDLSPNNVFVTEEPELQTQNVWLIDADNVFIPGEDSDKLVYTPRYAAPELLSGKPCSQYSDVYSFATLAFESLAALHPFVGEKASNWEDDGDDWDAESKKADNTPLGIDPAYSGKYPWVEDIEDDSNHTSDGLPRQNFLTDETFALFNMTFCEDGREHPKTRPTAVLWAQALAHAHATSVRCPKCGMSFVYDGTQEKCAWSDENLPALLILKDENEKIVFAHEVDSSNEGGKKSFAIPEHIFTSFNIDTFFRTAIKVRTVNDDVYGIEFKLEQGVENGKTFYMSINGNEEKILSRYILQPKNGEKYSLVCRDSVTGKSHSLEIVLTEEK